MIRTLMAASALLVALCAIQCTTLVRLKSDLQTADQRAYRAALVELGTRRDEFARVLTWLDAYLRGDGAEPGGGICSEGSLDSAPITDLVFDVYLRERANGASEGAARQRVIDALSAHPRERGMARP